MVSVGGGSLQGHLSAVEKFSLKLGHTLASSHLYKIIETVHFSAPSMLSLLCGALVTVQPPCFPFGSVEFATKQWETFWIKYSSTGTLSTVTSAMRNSSR